MDENFKTPIKQPQILSSSQTPIRTPNQTPSQSKVGYFTPINNSPFFHNLTPVSETKKLYDLNSNDALPMPSSTTDKNVHSPPKNPLTIKDIRSICEKNLLSLNKDNIENICILTNLKKKKVTQWFFENWFSSNKEVNHYIILRTVFSVFNSLRNDKKMDNEISKEFQIFWNNLKKEKRSRYKKIKKIEKKNKETKFQQFEDIGESFIN